MVKSAGRRLKVFQAHIGFFDTVVAVPSRAAALRAWGIHQNLFADGQACVATDPGAIAAALARPDTPLKRAVGSTDPYEVEAANLPEVPDAPKPVSRPKPKDKPAPPRKPAADRSALDRAEAALHKLDDARKDEQAALRRRQDDLDADREAAQTAYVERRRSAAVAVAKARAAYKAAGGGA